MKTQEEMQFEQDWNDAINQANDYDNKQNANKLKCLEYVKTQVEIGLYNDIIEYIEDCCDISQFEITRVKPNDKDTQTGGFDFLKEVWVNQYRSGGYEGDDFAGWVNVKINEKEFLKFHHSM